MSNRFAWLVNHRRGVVVLWLAVVVVAGFVASSVRTDFSVESYFPLNDPSRQIYEGYKAIYPQEDGQVVAFWSFGEALGPRSYSILTETARIFEQAGLEDVTWIGAAEKPAYDLFMEEWSLVPLVPENPSARRLSSTLRVYGNDSLYEGLLWDEATETFVVSGILPRAINTDLKRRELAPLLKQSLSALNDSDDELVLSGLPIIRARYLALLEKDQALFLGGGILLCFVVMFWFFRSPGQIFVSLLAIAPAYLVTLAGLSTIGRPLTALTVVVPLVLLVIGLSDSVHILATYRRYRSDGVENGRAIVTTFEQLKTACLFTSLTTAVGFLCLLSTGINIVVDFGAVTAVAIMLTYVSSMVFTPALLGFHTKSAHMGALRNRFLDSILSTARRVSRTHRVAIVAATVIVGTLAALQVPSLFVDVRMIDEKPEHPLVKEIVWAEERGFGLFQVNLLLRGDESPIARKEILDWIRNYVRHVERDPVVLRTISLNNWVESARAYLESRDGETAGSPEFAEEPVLEMIRDSDEHSAHLETVFSSATNTTQVIAFVKDDGSLKTGKLLDSLNGYLDANPLPGATAELTGTVVLSQTTFDRLVGGFAASLLWAIGAIGAILLIQLRSPGVALLALIPNLLPLLLLLAGLAFLEIPITPATVLVFSIAFGIAVDDTLHFLGAVARGRKEGNTWTESVDGAYEDCGRAILITSVVVTTGFSVLLASSFQATFLLGALTALALLAAVVSDLLVLPALLHLCDRWNHA